MVVWKNITPGLHTIPFGISGAKLIPFLFTPLSGYGNQFAVSTRNCVRDNRPLTNGVTNLNFQGTDAGDERVIDRWFHVNANGITASITATYLAEENSTNPGNALENFSFMTWYDSKWNLSGGAGNGSVDQPGTVTVNSMSNWGPLLMVSSKILEAADLLNFDAVLSDGRVNISWTAIPNISPDKYTVERSENEYQFSDLFEKKASPASGSPINYSGNDLQPLSGISYYRLKQHQTDGNLKYSQAVQIDNSKLQSHGIEILTVHPNPFGASFTAWYQVPDPAEIRIKLTGSNGQVVYSTTLLNQYGKNSFEFSDNSNLTPGLYILTISNGTSSKNIKLFHI
jgi:hypothetical protein